MSDVKYIFRVLLGTIVTIVVTSLLVEIFNVSITSVQINNLAKESAYQACALFTQETYLGKTGNGYNKSNNIGGVLNIDDVVGVDASGKEFKYIDSDLFGKNKKAEDIWKNIVKSQDFTNDFLGDQEISNMLIFNNENYNHNLHLLSQIIENPSISIEELSWDAGGAKIQNNIDVSTMRNMYDNLYTPANLGIPYIHKGITSSIFAWEAAQIFSNCNKENIRTVASDTGFSFNKESFDHGNSRTDIIDNFADNRGYATEATAGGYVWGMSAGNPTGAKAYVVFKGFRVYAQYARITGVDYKVYTLLDSNGVFKKDVAKELESSTHLHAIDPNNLSSVKKDEGITSRLDYIYTGADGEDIKTIPIYDNAQVIEAEVDFSIPVMYQGITPLNKTVSYIVNHRVTGMPGFGVNGKAVGDKNNLSDPNHKETISVVSDSNNMLSSKEVKKLNESGAITTPSTGKLYFNLVK